MAKDTRSRKYLLTINNPIDHNCSHEEIKKQLELFKGCKYWCMCDEVGEKGTAHTHVFIACNNTIRFSTVKERFPSARIDASKGTSQENRDYLLKEGKWEKDKKKETNLPDTFEEWGELPNERPGHRTDLADIMEMVKEGATNSEILESNSNILWNASKIDYIRQVFLLDKFKSVYRNMEVTYIYGETGVGKTRGIMEKHGYENVYMVSSYKKNPFDGYSGQDILLFDEYRSHFDTAEILRYLDGYPLMLPCRYNDKVACFTKVYITSNIPLEQQYNNLQKDEFESFKSFLRRITYVVEYMNTNFDVKLTTNEWLNGKLKTLVNDDRFDVKTLTDVEWRHIKNKKMKERLK